jgi:hypothetical protein
MVLRLILHGSLRRFRCIQAEHALQLPRFAVITASNSGGLGTVRAMTCVALRSYESLVVKKQSVSSDVESIVADLEPEVEGAPLVSMYGPYFDPRTDKDIVSKVVLTAFNGNTRKKYQPLWFTNKHRRRLEQLCVQIMARANYETNSAEFQLEFANRVANAENRKEDYLRLSRVDPPHGRLLALHLVRVHENADGSGNFRFVLVHEFVRVQVTVPVGSDNSQTHDTAFGFIAGIEMVHTEGARFHEFHALHSVPLDAPEPVEFFHVAIENNEHLSSSTRLFSVWRHRIPVRAAYSGSAQHLDPSPVTIHAFPSRERSTTMCMPN